MSPMRQLCGEMDSKVQGPSSANQRTARDLFTHHSGVNWYCVGVKGVYEIPSENRLSCSSLAG